MFQAMPPGESIELEVVRGYPLPFDPDDPNVETIGSYTVVHGPSPGSESPVPRSSEENSPVFPTYPPPPSQAMNKWSNSQGICTVHKPVYMNLLDNIFIVSI